MVELIGDNVEPATLVIPKIDDNPDMTSLSGGFLFLSGGKLHFLTGLGTEETITSS